MVLIDSKLILFRLLHDNYFAMCSTLAMTAVRYSAGQTLFSVSPLYTYMWKNNDPLSSLAIQNRSVPFRSPIFHERMFICGIHTLYTGRIFFIKAIF